MKKFIIATILLGSSFGSAHALCPPTIDAQPSVMAGLTFSFGGGNAAENFGFTLKMLNTNEANHFVLGAGGSYYPWSDTKFGLDLSAGYNVNEATALAGYDFLKKAPVFSGGWVNTAEKDYTCRT